MSRKSGQNVETWAAGVKSRSFTPVEFWERMNGLQVHYDIDTAIITLFWEHRIKI